MTLCIRIMYRLDTVIFRNNSSSLFSPRETPSRAFGPDFVIRFLNKARRCRLTEQK